MAISNNFVAGSYKIEYGEVGGNAPFTTVTDLGTTEVGFEMIMTPAYQKIMSDEAGRAPMDALWLGLSSFVVRVEFIEWTTTGWLMMNAFLYDGTTEGTSYEAGGLVRDKVSTLKLTPLTGNAEDLDTGGAALTYTFPAAYSLEPVRTVFSGQRLRSTAMGFVIFGDALSSGAVTYYTAA